MPSRTSVPPAWLVTGIGHIRSALRYASRSAVPPNVALLEIAQGAWLSQALYVAARLGIADALRDGPLSADEVARRVHTDADATHRLMRALASAGVLAMRRDGHFGLTRIGQALRSDDDGSMAPMITMIGAKEHWEHWGDLLHSVQTGETAVQKRRGAPMFEYLATNPSYAEVFNDAMTGVSALAIQAAVPAYDFTDRRLIVDVGGGHGALLTAVLAAAPQAKGVLFDLPAVVEGAGPVLDRGGVRRRCAVTGGSFFDSVPDGGDAYLLKSILHDWDDERSLAILRNIRTAIVPSGKLIAIEMVLPEGAPAHPGMLLDLEMLIHTGGRERTAAEYASLLAGAGFRLTRVLPTTGPAAIVEAVPA